MLETIVKDFSVIECYKCAILFAVSSQLHKHLMDSKQDFWCPNGHAQHYTKSTSEILQQELDESRKRVNSLINDNENLKSQLVDKKRNAKRSKISK